MNAHKEWFEEASKNHGGEGSPPRPEHHHNLLDLIGDGINEGIKDVGIAGNFVKDSTVEILQRSATNPLLAVELGLGAVSVGFLAVALTPVELPALALVGVGVAGAAAFPMVEGVAYKGLTAMFFPDMY